MREGGREGGREGVRGIEYIIIIPYYYYTYI
jgi:hypothetical protein